MPSPYITLARFPGDPSAHLSAYRASADTLAGVGRDHGLLVHAAAPTEDGFLVINVWPSREASEAAARDPRRRAALGALPFDPATITREHLDAEALSIRERD